MENPIKMDDLGVPLFLETSIKIMACKEKVIKRQVLQCSRNQTSSCAAFQFVQCEKQAHDKMHLSHNNHLESRVWHQCFFDTCCDSLHGSFTWMFGCLDVSCIRHGLPLALWPFVSRSRTRFWLRSRDGGKHVLGQLAPPGRLKDPKNGQGGEARKCQGEWTGWQFGEIEFMMIELIKLSQKPESIGIQVRYFCGCCLQCLCHVRICMWSMLGLSKHYWMCAHRPGIWWPPKLKAT